MSTLSTLTVAVAVAVAVLAGQARGQNYQSLGRGACRTASGATPQRYSRRVANDATCRDFCTVHAYCFAYAFDNDKDCFIYHPQAQANTPTGWSTCPSPMA